MNVNKEHISFEDFDRDDTINIREQLEKYLIHWKWFLLGVFLAFAGAYIYLRYTPPQFSAQAVILIKENKKAGVSAELKAFEDLGILGGSTNNLDNEIEIIKSRKIIREVIRNLKLNISYFIEGRITETELYKNSPFQIHFDSKDSIFSKVDTVFQVSVIDNQNFNLISLNGDKEGPFKFDSFIETKLGKFKLQKKISNIEKFDVKEIKIYISTVDQMIDNFQSKVSIAPINKNSSVITLSISDAVKNKAVDFLNELVSAYNRDAILDKNQVSKKTKDFIEERLEIVGEDLSSINNELKDFKAKNKITNVKAESVLVLESLAKNNSKIVETSIQLSLVKALNTALLKSNHNEESILAVNLGLEDKSIPQLIIEYNKLIIAKKKLLRTAGELNPQVVNITEKIKGLKSSLTQSLENSEESIKLTLKDLKKEDLRIKSIISSVPSQELQLHDIRLQQEITSGLYSYLLKKKEETAISLAVTVANAKIIDKAYGNNIAVSPKRRTVYFGALFLGILVPFIIIYLINLFDTKIHNKTDIEENLSVPFLGDVPKSDSKEKIVIGSDARSSTAEAFRLIRTNLDFMLANIKGKNKTIFVTSTTSGEGKSFISINVAASLALSGKKVLLMGMDLRAPKVTEYLGIPDRKGVTNYITDDDLDLENLIFNIDDIKNLDIISSGVVPPNPAELLMTKRTENLFTIIKEEYDYVVVDTAPVNLVTDTLLISKYADMFIYIARANYLDKRLLAVPQTLYKEKRLPNMAMVLNDTDPKRSYGYGYGGYGYGYVVEEKPWYKKILNR
jgi:capsular exopolysaccharide synthesis family protein